MGRVEKFTEKEKWCPACEKWLPLDGFWRCPSKKSGRRAVCASCEKIRKEGWKNSSDWHRRKIGGTPDVLDALWLEQKEVCGLCRKEIAGGRKSAHLDHDHITGELRGLIHGRCNWILGAAKDDPRFLRQAAGYLER